MQFVNLEQVELSGVQFNGIPQRIQIIWYFVMVANIVKFEKQWFNKIQSGHSHGLYFTPWV